MAFGTDSHAGPFGLTLARASIVVHRSLQNEKRIKIAALVARATNNLTSRRKICDFSVENWMVNLINFFCLLLYDE